MSEPVFGEESRCFDLYKSSNAYNSSEKLPKLIHFFRGVLLIIMFATYNWGCFYPMNDKSGATTVLKACAEFFLARMFLPPKSYSYILFSIAFFEISIFFYVLIFRTSLLLHKKVSYAVRLIIESSSPIFLLVTAGNFEQEMHLLIYDKQIDYAGSIFCGLALLMFLFLYWFDTHSSSNTIYIQDMPCRGLDTYPSFFSVIYVSCSMQLQLLYPKYDRKAFIIMSSFIILGEIYQFIILISSPYVSQLFTAFVFTSSLYGFLYNVFFLIYNIFQLNTSTDLVIAAFMLLFISYLSSLAITSKVCYATENFDASILYKSKNDAMEELSDLDLDEPTYFSYDLANSKKAIRVLRRMMFTLEPKTAEFAKFCILYSENIKVKLESYRCLLLIHRQDMFNHQDLLDLPLKKVPFSHRQMLYDMKKEVTFLDQYDKLDEGTINDLKNDLYQIRVALFGIIDSICTDTQTHLREILHKFNTERHNFEDHAFSKLLQTPDSYHISMLISKYYEDILHRADLAMRWREYGNSLNNPNSELQTKVEKLSKRHSKLDTTKAEGLYSILKTISSLSFWGLMTTLIIMAISLLILLIISLYPDSINPIMNSDFVNLFTLLSLISFKPQAEISKLLASTMASQDSYYEPFNVSIRNLKMEDLLKYQTFELINSIDVTLQDIRRDIADNVLGYWDQTAIKDFSNLTIRFEYAKFDAGQNFETSLYENNSRIINNFLERYNVLTFTIPILLNQIPDIVNSMEKRKIVTFQFYIISLAVILIEIIICMVFLVFRRKKEMTYYWEALLSIDVKKLTQMRSSLMNGENLVQEHNLLTSSTDSDNLLGSDEIESSGSNTSNSTETTQRTKFDPINEVDDVSNIKFCLGSPLSNVNLSVYAFLAILGSLIVFIGYPYTIIEFLRATSYLLDDTSDLVSATTHCMQLITLYAALNFTVTDNDTKSDMETMITTQQILLSNFSFEVLTDTKGTDLYTNTADIYKLINTIKELINETISITNQEVDKENLLNLTEYVYSNLSNSIYDYYENSTDSFNRTFHKVYVIKIVLSVLLFLSVFSFICLGLYRSYVIYDEDVAYKSILMLLQEKDLSMLTKLNELLNPVKSLTINRNTNDDQEISRQIFTTTTSSVFLLNSDFVIQDVNASGCQLLKRKKMNIIQSNMRSFIVKPSKNDIFRDGYYAMKNYIKRLIDTSGVSASKDNVFNLLVRSDDARITPVFVTVVNLTSVEVWDRSMCFGFIMNDCSEYSQKEQRYLEARQKISKLLNDILPPIIAMRLISKSEQRERAISSDQFPCLITRTRHRSVRFDSTDASSINASQNRRKEDQLISRVDKATVIFIGITNFVSWCNKQSHTEIMERLEIISTLLDSTLTQFPTLTKIKTINGVYMAAAGLFNEVTDKTLEHEAVQFAYEGGKKILEQQFFQQNSMSLVIGINTGGPIISGVLGTDKPFFDVWGDAVNVAARLETSADPNTMQMNYETTLGLPKDAFKIRERHGLKLKGKEGLFTAYVIDLVDKKE